MSNIANIFGSTSGALGPVQVVWDPVIQTGDSGDAVNLGDTQGITVRDQTEKSDLTGDQEGSQPFNRVVTGHLVEIEGNLVKTSYSIINSVMQGTNIYSSGAQGMGRRSAIGQDDLSIAKPIELTAIIGGAASTDTDYQLIFPLAAPATEAEWAYDASTQRILGFKFRCYRSPNYVDSTTGAYMYWFTRSALAAGQVVFQT